MPLIITVKEYGSLVLVGPESSAQLTHTMKSTLRLQIVVFTATRTVINTLFRMVYPFLPAISRGLGVELSQLYQALTWRALAGALGPFLASVGDSRGRKVGMLLGLGLFTVGVTVVVFSPTYLGLLVALILTALGKLAFDPTMQAYLGDRVPYQRRGLILAITELGWSGSFFIGIPVVGFLIARGGWVAPFPLLALLSLLSWVILLWLLPVDSPRNIKPPNMLNNLGVVFNHLPALAGLAVTFCISIAHEIVNLVYGVWMEHSFGLQVVALGLASTVIGFAELGGEGLVSVLTDRMGKLRAVGFGLVCILAAAIALPYLGRSLPGALVGLFFFYLAFEFTFVSIIPLMTELLPGARATLMAVNIASTSLARALAALLAPLLYRFGFTISALAAAVVVIFAIFALRGLTRDGTTGAL